MSQLPGLHTAWPFFLLLVPLALLDVILKGWGMWRAARMGKQGWFIALLIINSLGILPAIFLLLTQDEYIAHRKSPKKKR